MLGVKNQNYRVSRMAIGMKGGGLRVKGWECRV
jgi:hypothetical protein